MKTKDIKRGIVVEKIDEDKKCHKRGCIRICRDKSPIAEIHAMGSRYGWARSGIYLPDVLGIFNSRKEALRAILEAL